MAKVLIVQPSGELLMSLSTLKRMDGPSTLPVMMAEEGLSCVSIGFIGWAGGFAPGVRNGSEVQMRLEKPLNWLSGARRISNLRVQTPRLLIMLWPSQWPPSLMNRG